MEMKRMCNELVYRELGKRLLEDFHVCDFDYEKIILEKSIWVIFGVKEALWNKNRSDFEIVEEIVGVFRKYGLDTGGCHDAD
jgi:hypothetical protein